MFQKTRIKLTLWYAVIIAIICFLQSLPIFIGMAQTFHQLQITDNLQPIPPGPPQPPFPPYGNLAGIQARFILVQFVTNGSIIILGTILGYFLAGKTLRPIDEALKEQQRFLSDASHEMRTPLTSIRTELEYMLMKYTLPVAVKKHAKNILDDVDSMQQLTNALLFLSRNQDLPTETLTELSLLDVLESAIKQVVPLARAKHITIDNRIIDSTITAHRKRLTQVFVILLDNAIKYSSDGKQIRLRSHLTDKYIVIEIIDRGIGIEQSSLPHIFKRYYRGDQSRSRASVAGFGLGLSIATKIVEQHEGIIQVKSVVKKGSTFSVSLPLPR